jgi:hypothetical protein
MRGHAPIQGLKGRKMTAQGKAANAAAAPGNRPHESQALKGRKKVSLSCEEPHFCVALTGLDRICGYKPRALPWPIVFRPFGAEKIALGNRGSLLKTEALA